MFSKKLFSAFVLIAACSSACSNGDPTAPEQTSSDKSAQVIAPLACTPLLGAGFGPGPAVSPLLSCGAFTADNLALATSTQATLIAQMQTIFASVNVATDLVNNQVILTSPASLFTTWFGPQIIAPLNAAGFFTTSIPFTLSAFNPALSLTANIFGVVPGLNLLNSSLLPGFSSAAFNTSSAINTSLATSSLASLSAATMPVSFFISTPFVDGALFSCFGGLTLGCL